MMAHISNWISNGLIPPDTGMKKLLEDFTGLSDFDTDTSSEDSDE